MMKFRSEGKYITESRYRVGKDTRGVLMGQGRRKEEAISYDNSPRWKHKCMMMMWWCSVMSVVWTAHWQIDWYKQQDNT